MFYIIKKSDILCLSSFTAACLIFVCPADVLGHSRLAGLEHERLEDREADGAPRLHRLHLLVPHRLPRHHRRLRGPAHLTRGRQGLCAYSSCVALVSKPRALQSKMSSEHVVW
jgi:hypothetical protein